MASEFYIYKKKVEISDEVLNLYQEVYKEPLSDIAIQHHANCSESTPNMSEEELKIAIEESILEELHAYVHLPEISAQAERKGYL